jgi:hypothetical protein
VEGNSGSSSKALESSQSELGAVVEYALSNELRKFKNYGLVSGYVFSFVGLIRDLVFSQHGMAFKGHVCVDFLVMQLFVNVCATYCISSCTVL